MILIFIIGIFNIINADESQFQCLQCLNQYGICVGAGSSICTCASTAATCFQQSTCNLNLQTLCPQWGTCSGITACPTTSGCPKCVQDYSTCMQDPTKVCTCLGNLKQCNTDNSCAPSTVSAILLNDICPIYSASCPNLGCISTGPCMSCSTDYYSCAIQAFQSGTTAASICNCAGSFFNCISSSNCSLTPYLNLCNTQGSLCETALQCSGSIQVAISKQVVGLIKQFQTVVISHLQAALSDALINFNNILSEVNREVIQITVTIPATYNTIEDFINDLKTEFADYFKVPTVNIDIQLIVSQKRDINGVSNIAASGSINIYDGSAPNGAVSNVVSLVMVMIALLIGLMF